MNDPYKILGVSADASDKEIKQAYRELVHKYHPDNYHDNPLADLAQEKMKEINEAYTKINRMRETGESFNPGRSSGKSTSGSPEGMKVRSAIHSGDLELAEKLLDEFSDKNAEWNFLMGGVCYKKGWFNDALGYFQTAVDLEPGNSEYKYAVNKMNQSGNAYRPFGRGGLDTNSGCNACDCCALMLCANMCCRC